MKFFKILNGFENIARIFFSLKKDSRTKGHELTLVNDQCRLDILRTINEWNELSTASSVNMLKTRLTHISGRRVSHR